MRQGQRLPAFAAKANLVADHCLLDMLKAVLLATLDTVGTCVRGGGGGRFKIGREGNSTTHSRRLRAVVSCQLRSVLRN